MNHDKIDLIFKDEIEAKSPKASKRIHIDLLNNYNTHNIRKSPIKKQCTFNLNFRTDFSPKKKGILKKEKSLKNLNNSHFFKSNIKNSKRNSTKIEKPKNFNFSKLVKKMFKIDYNIQFDIIQKKIFSNLKINNEHNNNIEYINTKKDINGIFNYRFKNLKITKNEYEINSNFIYKNKIKKNNKKKYFCCF